MNTFIRLMMLLGMFAVAHPVMANEPSVQQPGQGIDKRVERQNKRIEHKLKKKKITEAQAQQLKSDVQAVEVKKETMIKENNGKLSKVQRKELHQELKKTSEEIKSAGTSATTQK